MNEANFLEVFVNGWSKILKQECSISEFMDTSISIGDNVYSIKDVKWRGLSSQKDLFTLKNFNTLLTIDSSGAIDLYLKAMSSLALDENLLSPLFNAIDNKQHFYKNIHSFKTLISCEHHGIDVWQEISVNKELNTEQLVPLAAWDWQNKLLPSVHSDKIYGKEIIGFFTKNEKKWRNFATEHTSSEEFHSRIAYRASKIKSKTNYIKSLNLKIDNHHQYCFPWGETVQIRDLYLREGNLKKIKSTEMGKANPELEVLKLIKTKIHYEKGNLISNRKKFNKLWFSNIKKINYGYMDDIGNLAHHTFSNISLSSPRFYLPIKGDLLQESEVNKYCYFSSQSSMSSESLLSWLFLLKEKKIDFFSAHNLQPAPITSLLSLLSYQELNYSEEFVKPNGLVDAFWTIASPEQKELVFNEYMKSWEHLKKSHLESDFSNRYNSWNNPSSIVNILELFAKERFFLNMPQYNASILSLIEPYAGKKPLVNIYKTIYAQNQYANLDSQLIEKNEKDSLRIKI